MNHPSAANEDPPELARTSDDCIDCEQALDRLYEFLDSEMTPGDVARMKEHIASCSTCLSEYDLEEHVRELVRRSCCERAPIELRTRILTQITVVRQTRLS